MWTKLPSISLTLVSQTCKNPTNPMFAHHLFECVAALMRFICEASPDAVKAFEGMLMTPFQEVLAKDVVDFLPYVFQLLAQLLELRPTPRAGVTCSGVSMKSF